MHRPHAHAARVRAGNRRDYELLVEMTQHFAARGEVDRVLRAAMAAANHAWLAPNGLLSDLRLERAVVHAVRGAGAVHVDGTRETGRVLHVLSEAYHTGGHTRLVWRWMNRDPRMADVVLTNHRGAVPERLVEGARRAGGQVHDLLAGGGDLLSRARALRQLMDTVDLVVLHVHPYDTVALAAAVLPGTRPPVVFENHTDQSFWLGLGAVDVLCDLREEARPLDLELRGLPADRIAVLPMPIEPPLPTQSTPTRRDLGIAEDAVVALTVSAGYKMAPCWGRGMPYPVERVLRWAPQVVVVVVGATPDPAWTRLAGSYPGRVLVTGTVLDTAPWFALADLYLDSYPMRSTTAALEAGSLGLPVLTLTDLPASATAAILQANSPGLAGLSPSASVEKLATAARRLAADADLRRSEGERVRAAVLALHDGAGWHTGLEELYQQAREAPAADVDALTAAPADERFGDMLVSMGVTVVTPDPQFAVGPLGDLYDGAMQAALFAVLQRDTGPSLSVRVAAGWDQHPAWTSGLVRLAADHPRLRVSMPFLPDDDAAGTRTTDVLLGLITGTGLTAETCGDLFVEVQRPVSRPTVSDELPFTDAALDWLEQLVGSPCWDPLPSPAAAPGGALVAV